MHQCTRPAIRISIHALREESDLIYPGQILRY